MNAASIAFLSLGLLAALAPCAAEEAGPVTAKFRLDHNRIIIDAELRKPGGEWRPARLWLDTGAPAFTMSGELASSLGLAKGREALGLELRVGGKALDFSGVREAGISASAWLLPSAGADANLPSTVLRRYDLLVDYPARTISLAPRGSLRFRGTRLSALVEPSTGIAQIEVSIGGKAASLAIDLGASYTFVDGGFLEPLAAGRPDWPSYRGPAGCANMWGWWPPAEETWKVYRLPSIRLGPGDSGPEIQGLGLVSLPAQVLGGLGEWYSAKTARRVEGFLGPNAFKAFRLGIDYARGAIYLERAGDFDAADMDLVPLGLRRQADGSWLVSGVASRGGKPLVAGLEAGDLLVSVDGQALKGLSMGPAVDALRGTPGSEKVLVLLRKGREKSVRVKAARLP